MKPIIFQTIREWELFKQLAKGQNFTEPVSYNFPITIECNKEFAESVGY